MSEQLIKILKGVKDKWGADTVAAIVKEIDRYPIKWKGVLRRSVSYEQQSDLDGDITFNMADYGKFIDEGIGIFGPRNQRIPKRSIPGLAFYLRPWAQSKGLNPWAVATKIVERGGIKPRPFFNSVIQNRVPQLGEAITEAYTIYLNESINNLNNQ
jgi:hypothetical protein